VPVSSRGAGRIAFWPGGGSSLDVRHDLSIDKATVDWLRRVGSVGRTAPLQSLCSRTVLRCLIRVGIWSGLRNSGVYNAGEWPLRPETHFAGGHLPEGQRWEAYGPHLELDRQWFSERIQYSGLLGALGLSVPQYRSEEDAASALLPVGTVAVTAQAAALVLLLKPNKGAPPNGGPA